MTGKVSQHMAVKNLFFPRKWIAVYAFLLRQNHYYDIVKFQINLEMLASSKNFDKRLRN